MDDSIWPLLLLQVVLIALNAVFAAAEIAIVSMNDNKMAKMAKEGNKKAARLVKLTSQPSRFLATIQIAITLAGFLGAASAAESFSDVIVEAVMKTGISIPENLLNSVVVFLITLIISFLNIVFGELVPKRIAMRNPESFALGISGLIFAISKIFKPIVWLLTASTNLVLRLFKIDPNENDDEVSEEDIRMMVDVGSENGTIDRTEKEFIQNVFEFDDLTAGEVAVHRTEVSLLWLDESPEDWDKTIHGSRHKIYPVCNETVDNVVGILNAKDYFRLGTKDRETVMKKAVHPAYFVPESVKLDVLFQNMKKSRNSFAVVLDEYGGTTGIITINDLVEQLVGDFDYDDSNEPKPIEAIESLDSKTWKIIGNPALDDIEDALGISLKTEECDTFSGLVFEALGLIPDDGCKPFEVETDGLVIKVLKVKNHQVQTAVVCKASPKKDTAEQTKSESSEEKSKNE
ncbi:MAG TPA: hemolysin family protein [Candidatus Eubacterium faecipullorum]|uniref:Hemolysin family protein n=1 Tax=Candidatus Eubacterium faecipullorum TaxID=2838571 RepID=A0A9D1RF66_9FIRM|nr:hemolysin family protein [Candidatus Eubacterium faecipullorum]